MMVITEATAMPTPISMMMMPTWLPCVASAGQRAVFEERAAADHAGDAHARIEQHAQAGDHHQEARGRDGAHRLRPEDEAVEDEARREDDAGLKAAARPVVAVHLHVEGEQQDRRDQQLRDHAQDQMLRHARSPVSSSPFSPARRRRVATPSISSTPMPAVKITVTSPSVSKPR